MRTRCDDRTWELFYCPKMFRFLPMKNTESERRNFFRRFVQGAGALLMLPSVGVLLQYLMNPRRSKIQREKICAVSELNEFHPSINFSIGAVNGIVVLDENKNLHAFNRKCSHLGCMVAYQNEDQRFFCNCHKGTYDLQGKVISGPPPRPLSELQVEIFDDTVFVTAEFEALQRYS